LASSALGVRPAHFIDSSAAYVSSIKVSQRSVATNLRCDEVSNGRFIQFNTAGEEFRKSINIWQVEVSYFLTHGLQNAVEYNTVHSAANEDNGYPFKYADHYSVLQAS